MSAFGSNQKSFRQPMMFKLIFLRKRVKTSNWKKQIRNQKKLLNKFPGKASLCQSKRHRRLPFQAKAARKADKPNSALLNPGYGELRTCLLKNKALQGHSAL